MDDGRVAGPAHGAVRLCLGGFLRFDARHRRPGNRALAGCGARTCPEGVRDHRPQPVGNQRDDPRHSGRRHQVPRGSLACPAEAARRFAAADEVGLDLRRKRPGARQQSGVACSRRRFLGSGLFQGACRPRHRNFHWRCADPAPALSGRVVLQRQPPPAERGRQLRRRDPGFGASGIFREFLRQDRPRLRQLLRARFGGWHGTGPLSRARPRHPHRSRRPGRTNRSSPARTPASSR